MAVIVFVLGALPLILVIVTRDAGAYGVGALIPALVVCCAIVVMGISAALSIVDRLWRRTRPFPRTIAALAAFGAATVCLAPAVAELVGVAPPSIEGWLPTVAGVALLALAAILAAGRSERLPALVFAAGWVLLLGIAGYSVWTEMEVDVAWLGPNSIEDSPGQIAFSATRPGDFEVRFGASSCSEGEVIATGRYDHQPGRPGSEFGELVWVELPAEILPLERGDLVRVCVRDGFAAATRAGEVSMAPSFWQRD